MQTTAQRPPTLALDLLHTLVTAAVVSVAWFSFVLAVLSTNVNPILAVLLVAVGVGRFFGTIVTQIRDLTRIDFSRTVTQSAWLGTGFGVVLLASWNWAIGSGFEAWLEHQHSIFAFWNW